MRDIGGVGEAVPAQVMGGADQRKAFRKGESFEVDIRTFTDDTAATVGADDPGAVELFCSIRRAGCHTDAAARLGDIFDVTRKAYFRVRQFAQFFEYKRREPVLLEVETKRKGGFVGKQG